MILIEGKEIFPRISEKKTLLCFNEKPVSMLVNKANTFPGKGIGHKDNVLSSAQIDVRYILNFYARTGRLQKIISRKENLKRRGIWAKKKPL